jgi:hypothetical protein
MAFGVGRPPPSKSGSYLLVANASGSRPTFLAEPPPPTPWPPYARMPPGHHRPCQCVLSVAPVVHRPGDLCQRAVQGQGTSDSLTPITTNARGDIVVVSVLMPSGPTPLRPYCTVTSRRRQRNEYLYLPCTVQSAPVHGAAVHVRVSQ